MRRVELTQMRLASLGLCLALTAAAAQAQEPTRLSRPDARELAGRLIDQNQPRAAAEIANGLLLADPNDLVALLVLARAQSALGDATAAAQTARRAWQAANTDPERFVAAVTRARVLSAADRLTGAQYWLRRAVELSPNEPARTLVAQDYATIRNANPLAISAGFGVTPASNINNGSANSTTVFEGLPFVFELSPDAQALSGGEVSVSANLSYVLSKSDRHATYLTLDGAARSYWLSQKSASAAPDTNGSDFGYATIGVGLSHRFMLGDGAEPILARLRADKSWYAEDAYSTGLTFGLSRDYKLSESDLLSVSATMARTQYIASGQSAAPVTLSANWTHDLANQDKILAGLSLTRSFSETETRSYNSARLSLGYDFQEISAGFDLSVSLAQEWRNFDSPFFGPAPREDSRQSAGVTIGVRSWDLFGFQPILSVEASQTHSNVDLYDSTSLRTGISFRSSF